MDSVLSTKLLGPDGQPFNNGTLIIPSLVTGSGSNLDSKLLTEIHIPESSRELDRRAEELTSQVALITDRDSLKQAPINRTNQLIEDLSNNTGLSESDLIQLLNNQFNVFMQIHAFPYLVKTENNNGYADLLTMRLSTLKDVEGLLDRTQEVYEFIKTNAANKAVQLEFLQYILLLIKHLRKEGSTSPPYSDKFRDFLVNEFSQENDKNCKGFIEQFLIFYIDNINEIQAKQLLTKLHAEYELTSDLAQQLLLKYPHLKELYPQTNLNVIKELSIEEILANRAALTLISQNQVDILTKYASQNGKVGFEVEMHLDENFARDEMRQLIEKCQYFAKLSKDYTLQKSRIIDIDNKVKWVEEIGDISDHSELRSYGRGFKLNAFTFPILYKLITDLTLNKGLEFYGTNHIHVDKKNFYPQDSIINFRRANFTGNGTPYDKGWETTQVPLARPQYPKLDNKTDSPFFSVSNYYDQMQLVNGVYDIQVKDTDPQGFSELSDANDRKYLALMPLDTYSKPSQDFLGKFYIFQCKNHHREDLIPAVLRLWHEAQLPNISYQTYSKIFELNNIKIPNLSFFKKYKNNDWDVLVKYCKLFEKEIDLDLLLTIRNNLPYDDKQRLFSTIVRHLDFPNKPLVICELMNKSGIVFSHEIFDQCKQTISLEDTLQEPYISHFTSLYINKLINVDLAQLSKDQICHIIEESKVMNREFFDELGKPFTKEETLPKIQELDLLIKNPDTSSEGRSLKSIIQSYAFSTRDWSFQDLEENNLDLATLLPTICEKTIPLNDYVLNTLKNIASQGGYITMHRCNKIISIISRLDPKSDFTRLRELIPIIDSREDVPGAVIIPMLTLTNSWTEADRDRINSYGIDDFLATVTESLLEADKIDLHHPVLQRMVFVEGENTAQHFIRIHTLLNELPKVNSKNQKLLVKLPKREDIPRDLEPCFDIVQFLLIALRKIKPTDLDIAPEEIFRELYISHLLTKLDTSLDLKPFREDAYIAALNRLKAKDIDQIASLYHGTCKAEVDRSFASLKRVLVSQIDKAQVSRFIFFLQNFTLKDTLTSFALEQFYFIEAGKLIPKQKINIADNNFREFLIQLSRDGLVVEDPLLEHLQEFSFKELEPLLDDSSQISQANIAKLMEKRKQTNKTSFSSRPIEFDTNIENLITNVSIHPGIRSAILDRVGSEALQQHVNKYGPLRAKI